MVYETIIFEKEDNVGIIKFNRPKALNAINPEVLSETQDALNKIETDQSIKVLVLTGEGDKAFVAGADISHMVNLSPLGARQFAREGHELGFRLESLPIPVIACVNGFALGGGTELAMASDFIYASETAKFGQPEINLGVIPGAGGTQRLTLAVGKAIAMEMVLNNRTLNAEEALHYGLVNRVAPLDSYLDEALHLAAEIAGRAPLAVRFGKEAVNKSFELSLTEGLEAERRAFYGLFATEDQKEGMTAFIDKRKPNWEGT